MRSRNFLLALLFLAPLKGRSEVLVCKEVFSQSQQFLSVGFLQKIKSEKLNTNLPVYQRSALASADPLFDSWLEKTVEVISVPNPDFVHIKLRIGKKLYSFRNVRDNQVFQYQLMPGKPGQISFVYSADPLAIHKMQKYADAVYENSKLYNVPPYDGDSGKLLVNSDKAGIRYESDSEFLPNNDVAQGKIVQQNGKSLLETPKGFLWPVQISKNKIYAQSLSCATSTWSILQQSGVIGIPYDPESTVLVEKLLASDPKNSSSPLAVIID